MSEVPYYAGKKIAVAKQLRAEIEDQQSEVALLGATIELARVPQWKAYNDAIKKQIGSKVQHMLSISDEHGDLAIVDRKRATLQAEINVLGPMTTEKDRAEIKIKELSAKIDQNLKIVEEIERAYSFVSERSTK